MTYGYAPGNAGGVLVEAGEYTPTLTGISNVEALTLRSARYTRIGDFVLVDMAFTLDTTASGDTIFEADLPVASPVTAYDLSGAAVAYVSAAISGGAIIGNNGKARVRINAGSTSARDYTARFSYKVI